MPGADYIWKPCRFYFKLSRATCWLTMLTTLDLESLFSIVFYTNENSLTPHCAKKVVSDSPGLGDFQVRLVNSVLSWPEGQTKFLWILLQGSHEREILRASENDLDSSGSECGKPGNRLHAVIMALLVLRIVFTNDRVSCKRAYDQVKIKKRSHLSEVISST